MPAPKYSFDLQEAICELVRRGNVPYIAARTCRISHQTHYNWMERGESGESPYVEYLEAIKTAEADGEMGVIAKILEAAEGREYTKRREIYKNGQLAEVIEETQTKAFWQAAAWIAERRFGERWRNKELTAEDAIKVLAKALLSGDEDIARELRSAIAQAAKHPSA